MCSEGHSSVTVLSLYSASWTSSKEGPMPSAVFLLFSDTSSLTPLRVQLSLASGRGETEFIIHLLPLALRI